MLHPCLVRLSSVVAILVLVGIAASPANATVVSYLLSFENDMELMNDPFGSILVTDEDGLNKLTFTIDIDNSKLGAAADIHEFGFQLSGYSGALTLSPTVISGQSIQLFQGPSNDTKVSGMGNTEFDYLVHFGSGNPTIEPVTFMLQGDSAFGLSNLNPLDTILTNTGKTTNFGLHIQSTSTRPGSEALGGRWLPNEPVIPVISNSVPEPTSSLTWFVLSSLLFASGTRRRK